MSKKTKATKPIDDKVEIARIIAAMSDDELMTMAGEIVDLNSNEKDDGSSGYSLESCPSVKRLLRNWAKGLGSVKS